MYCEQTNAEAFYYLKQMQARTPIVVKLLADENTLVPPAFVALTRQ